jgi:hypothetical protein
MVRHEIGKISGPGLHQARHGGQTTKFLHSIGVLWEGNLNSQDFCEFQFLVTFLFTRGIDPHSSPLSHGSLLAPSRS